jgi:protein-S-isoprenylcysteine O-methyltransferase Ste14
VQALGLALVLGGAALAARSAALLAGRGRPVRGPRPAFVLAGPYLRVRNPLLGGVVVALAGGALAARSWWLATAAVAAALAAHAWVVRVEEPRLRTRFGPAYEAYLARVPRWCPAPGRRPDGDGRDESPPG